MSDTWNVILYKLDGNMLLNPENNPKQSGKYLCTCILMLPGESGMEEASRYLHIMEYDAERDYWHDCNNPSGISHNILAWTNKISVCDFADYDYVSSGYLVERQSCEEKSDKSDSRMDIQEEVQSMKDGMVGFRYRHFKGGIYVVTDVAVHSETEEPIVVYKSFNKPHLVWCRPLSMFLSEVDHEKYPNVKQLMRFERIGDDE